MSNTSEKFNFVFSANKVHVHHWPLNSPVWSDLMKKNINLNLNKNIQKQEITIHESQIRINNYEFDKIKKVGVTVPLFKKETRIVFEGQCSGFDTHVHITTNSKEYLDIFNQLMNWKNRYFPD